MLLLRLGLRRGDMDGAVRVLGGSIERVEPQRLLTVVDHVVAGTGRNDDGIVRLDGVALAVDEHFPLALLDPEELIAIVVHFRADLLARLE